MRGIESKARCCLIILNQVLSFSSPTKIEELIMTARSDEKNTAQPRRGFEQGSINERTCSENVGPR